MNTPTPEDIALAERIADELSRESHTKFLVKLIADHCAPLRERIAILDAMTTDQVANDMDAQDLLELVRTLEKKADQLERDRECNAELVKELKPLAEIGRLAVEERKACKDDSVDVFGYGEVCARLERACDAYITKEPKP
jgi:hypothetical protein